MSWFFIAILAPILWSLVNHTDKYLLSRHLHGVGKGVLILYSTLFAIITLPVVFIIHTHVLNVKGWNAALLVATGVINSIAIYLYLYALEEEETSVVVPFFQVIPVSGYIFGMIFLKETLALPQIVASLLIILGAFILALEFKEGKINIKKKLFIMMIVSSTLVALNEVWFKVVALEENFWVSIFWQQIGLLVFGVILLLLVPAYRQEFRLFIQKNKRYIFWLNVGSETITVIGNVIFNFSLLLAPVALVMLVNAYQPLFVFLGGIFLTHVFPKLADENLSRTHITQKFLAILIMILGSYLLYLYT